MRDGGIIPGGWSRGESRAVANILGRVEFRAGLQSSDGRGKHFLAHHNRGEENENKCLHEV